MAGLRPHPVPGFYSIHKRIRRLSHSSDYQVYSFDVFDTLLRRRIEPPELTKALVSEHLSALLARHGMIVHSEEILQRRNDAERLLQQQAMANGKDATSCLDDIMAETIRAIKADLILSSDEIVSYEIDLEKKAAEPMPGASEVLAHLASLGKRIICVSETYLSLPQMESLLEHHNLLQHIDRLYLSSDTGRSKMTKGLFQHVVENEGNKIVHIGDNYLLDNSAPRSLGIKTMWFHSRGEELRKSKLRRLLNGGNKMDYVNAVVGSADRDKSALYSLGYEVLGPAMAVFVHSVAEQATEDGVDTIFFVARDGYVMKKVYELLLRNIHADGSFPTGKYMCLSRFPVRLASLHGLDCEEASEVYAYI
ncbi:MAG: HAD-IA family hydrolase, partial [Dehalococcoidia bacterium]